MRRALCITAGAIVGVYVALRWLNARPIEHNTITGGPR